MRLTRRLVLGALLVLAACQKPTAPDRVIVLGLDGMDPNTVDLLMAEGKMPNFAALRAGGAYGRLVSMPPLLSPIIWTTIATGKPPDQHHIGQGFAQRVASFASRTMARRSCPALAYGSRSAAAAEPQPVVTLLAHGLTEVLLRVVV